MINIPEAEHGQVRLFALDLPASEARAFEAEAVARLPAALGSAPLDMEYVEIFDASELDGLGLPAFLTEGHGIAASELAGDRARLEALTGPLVVIASGAFRGAAQGLQVRPPLRWIGTWGEQRSPASMESLASANAMGSLAGAPPLPGPQAPRLNRLVIWLMAGLALILLLGLVLSGAL